MALNEEGEWIDPDINDLLILGRALIRRHDKGEMTEATIKKYVDGVQMTYSLSKEQAQQLHDDLVKSR